MSLAHGPIAFGIWLPIGWTSYAEWRNGLAEFKLSSDSAAIRPEPTKSVLTEICQNACDSAETINKSTIESIKANTLKAK